MFEVKAAVDVDDNIFVRSGYSANASIMIENRENVLAVPESVLEFEEDKTYAYVLTSPEGAEEQTFEKREVTTGLSDGMEHGNQGGTLRNRPAAGHGDAAHQEIAYP